MTKTILSAFSLALVLFLTPLTGKIINAQGIPENAHVPDSYIIVFQDSVANPIEHASDMARQHGLSLAYTYSHALKGFSSVIPAARLEKIKNDPSVKFVSQDRYVGIDVRPSAKPTPTPVPQPVQQVPKGVLRIGQNLTNTGAGIGIAVLDTGIDLDHPDLAGNILGNTTCVNRTSTGNDDNGHGTHVAGTIAAIDNSIGVVGIAPSANLYAVKVLDKRGSGSWSSIICGIDWVTARADIIKVANMSLGGGGSSDNDCGNTDNDALHQAICRSRDAGVTYVVAAGNENDNAANHVPAAYNDAVITVSALVDTDGKSGGLGSSTGYGADDTFASFSNYSPTIVDLGAPGVNILSTWKGDGYNTISGTSMATPHVAGAAALYIKNNPGSSWSQVRNGLVSIGETSGHTSTSLHPERVVFTGSL